MEEKGGGERGRAELAEELKRGQSRWLIDTIVWLDVGFFFSFINHHHI